MITKNSSYSFFIIFLISILTVGCATIFKGSDADIRVNSQPSDASIFINEIDRGNTPQTLTLGRDQDHILTFKKDGYEDVRIEVNKKFDGATTILGNLVSWWVIGVVVDVASGAAYSLEPADVQANLEEMQASGIIDEIPSNDENSINVIMLTEEEWSQIQKMN
jgi:hypothetical protein